MILHLALMLFPRKGMFAREKTWYDVSLGELTLQKRTIFVVDTFSICSRQLQVDSSR